MVLRDAGRIGKAKEQLALYQQYNLIRPASNDAWLDEIAALNLSAQDHLNRGLALEAAGDLKGSAIEHEKALKVELMLVQAHLNLIQLYFGCILRQKFLIIIINVLILPHHGG